MSEATEAAEGETDADSAVTTTVDEIDGEPHVVIADTARDDAWIAMPERSAASLEARQ